ncbi:DNA glycosylase [Clostridia bacterium]|nr:DNA glycosylase [Clostridia bacterium]
MVKSGPISLDKIARSGQTFRWRAVEDSLYIIPALGRELHARQVATDSVEFSCSEIEWEDVWADYFDWNTDYAAIAALANPDDTYLTAACQAAYGMRMLRQDLWETIVSFICSQNNNIPRITGMLNRICGACDGFPDAERLLDAGRGALSSCGLGYRMEYLIRAAEQFIADKPRSFLYGYGYAKAREYLLTYHGIGPKVADCICLYGLGMAGAFPRDVWVKRIESRHYGGAFPVELYPDCAGILQLFMFWYERTQAV